MEQYTGITEKGRKEMVRNDASRLLECAEIVAAQSIKKE